MKLHQIVMFLILKKTIENTTSDVEDNAKKSGIKVNGGEAGKLPDWMQGDY